MVAVIVFVTLVCSLGISIAVPFVAYAKFHCMSHWADEYTARAQRVSDANAGRISRLTVLTAAEQNVWATVKQPFDQKKFLTALHAEQQAYQNYKAADAAATKAAEDNPLPSPPKLRC